MVWFGKRGFRGGVHLTNGRDKALSSGEEIISYEPEQVRISMEQSRGNRCRLLVRAGERVEAGQPIGEPESFGGARIHASISGVVDRIELELGSGGEPAAVCVIRRMPGGRDLSGAPEERWREPEEKGNSRRRQDYRKQLVNLEGLSRETILKGLEDGGVTGLGGAGFPAFRKYETDRRIQTVLINGAECEPYLTCDHRLMLEHGMEILNGARVLARCADAGRVMICVEDNKRDAAEHLKKLLKEDFTKVSVCLVPARYPQGGERQLIQTVLGREVPEGGLPADLGVLVSNVGTAKAAADAVLGGIPLIRRCVTVSGEVEQPGNFMVPIGTSLRELVSLCQGISCQENRVITGGPMTGTCVTEDWDGESEVGEVKKGLSGLIVLERKDYEESSCIRCGGCVDVCPAGLKPFEIDFAWLQGKQERCQELYAGQCILCGSCSFVCPARRQLAWRVGQARLGGKAPQPVQAAAPGPYLRNRRSVSWIMGQVLISLVPALAGSVYFFGGRSLLVAGMAVLCCVLAELGWQAAAKQKITVTDLSAAVTGVLLAMNLPVSVPLWAVAAASVFAIILVKQFFGGIGCNFLNPALMGRLLLMVVWPGTMVSAPGPVTLPADMVSSATVLSAVRAGEPLPYSYWQMFLGEIPGALGETSKLLLLIGFAYLCYLGIVNVQAALSYIGAAAAVTWILGPEGLFTGNILGNLLGGGLLLGGFYMTTDYGYSTRRGRALFGLTAGLLTGLLRVYGPYSEAVCFGILAANGLAGLTALAYRPHVYGTEKGKMKGVQAER